MARSKIVQEIATALKETESRPLRMIGRVVKVKGEDQVRQWMAEALRIEAGSGMLTDDDQQARTVGGIFFKLVKNGSTSRERGRIFGPSPHLLARQQTLSLSEADLLQLTREIMEFPAGEVKSMRLTLIGRPGRVIEKGPVVITTLSSKKIPALPKGLPRPAVEPATYVVYIAAKQWRKVREAIQNNPDEALIVEGYPVFDRRLGQQGTMTLYAQKVMAKLLQRNKRVPKG